jgi:hypothetical protein
MTAALGSVEIGPREGRRVTVARTTEGTDVTVTLPRSGRALRIACEIDPRRTAVASTRGVVE